MDSSCKHVDEMSRKVSSVIGTLKRPFIYINTAIQIYSDLIILHVTSAVQCGII